MRFSIALLLAGLAFAGCRPRAQTYEEMSPKERLHYLRTQTGPAALAESTNEVPGIRAVVELNLDDLSDASVKWTGTVRVDYMNHIGGIDRTNLYLKFLVASDGRVFALPDSAYYEAQYQARLAELERGTGPVPSSPPADAPSPRASAN